MKILLINKYHYKKGGSETAYFALSRILEQQGHEVIHFAMQHENNLDSKTKSFFAPKVSFEDKGFFTMLKNIKNIFWNTHAKRRLEALLTQENPDICHVHNFSHQLSPSILFALKKHKIPTVMTCHDYKVVCPNYTFFAHGKIHDYGRAYWKYVWHKTVKNSYLKSLILVLEAYFIRLFQVYQKTIHTFIAPSTFMKQKLIEGGVKEKSIVTRMNMLEDNCFEESPSHDGSLCYVGRLSEEKGLWTLLRAAKQLTCPIHIIGGGPLEKAVSEYVAKEKLSNVKLHGHLPKALVKSYVNKCAAVVVPSLWYENNPYSILEAFGVSTPVLASHIGGIPELVLNGKTGFTFAPHDDKALVRFVNVLLSDEKQRLAMAQNAYAFVREQANAQGFYEDMMHIYKDALS